MTPPENAAILRNVHFAHTPGNPVLIDVTLTIESGERLAIVGPNGGGKTTLLRLLLGLLQPDSGSVEVFGLPPAKARRRIGYVPQHAALDLLVPATALDTVLMGCLHRSPWGARFASRYRAQAMAGLEKVGLESLAHRRLHELSGGQLQRVLIARALIAEPEILLLDEPTSGVDRQHEEAILQPLFDLTGLTMVLVTHDERLCAEFDRVTEVRRRVQARPSRVGMTPPLSGAPAPQLRAVL